MSQTTKDEIEIDWYRTPLDRETLKKLNQRSDLQGAIQSLGFLFLLILSAAFPYWAGEQGLWGWMAVGLFLHGMVASFCINGVHELVHGTVFRTKWLNEFFAGLFSFYGLINHRLFWGSHSEHHKFTLHNPEDQEVILPFGYSVKEFFLRGFVDITGFIYNLKLQIRLAKGVTEGTWEASIMPDAAQELRRAVFQWSRWLLIGHGLIFAISLALGNWLIPLILLSSICLGRWLQTLCNHVQHIGLVDYVSDFRMCCRTVYLNPLLRFLYWNMNYHIEHHMYAGVPCYNLPKLHQAILHDLPHCRHGLLGTWREVAGILKKTKVNPDFQYQQELRDGATPYHLEKPKIVRAAGRNESTSRLRKWECQICGFIYDEAKGLPEEGIAPGTRWEDIPEDWSCPDCGVAKVDFEMILLAESATSDAAAPIASADAQHSTKEERLVIVGSGLAGYTLSKDLRKKGYQGTITIVTRDRGEWYYKPDLSAALQKSLEAEELVKKTVKEMQDSLQITVMTQTACRGIDRSRKELVLSEGSLAYDKLVLATGAEPLNLPIETDCPEKIIQINDLEQYRTYREQLPEQGRVLILGAGLVGCEFANDLVRSGYHAEVVDIADSPLNRFLPESYAEEFKDELARAGIVWRLGSGLKSVTKQTDGSLFCQLEHGESVTVDLVISAVGLKPRTKLADAAGITCNRGIIVDDFLKTSEEAIYALGDCAELAGEIRPFVAWLRKASEALSSTLTGTPTVCSQSAQRIVVKTPCCPLEILPIPPGVEGVWLDHQHEDGIDAFFVNTQTRTICGEIKLSYVRKQEMSVT